MSSSSLKLNRAAIPKSDYLSTGSTLLNLACSGMPNYGLTKGRYFWMFGDSSSGKTWLTLGCLAEAANDPNWDEYDLIYDNVEDGALMDMERYFGAKMALRLQAPRTDEDGNPIYSEMSEDFYFNLDDRLTAVEKGKAPPFIYLLDSMDALDTRYAEKKFKERKAAARKAIDPATGKKAEAKGDYGDGKAKINSQWIRGMVRRLRKTRSTLIILSQARDNIDGGMFEPASIAGGGRALRFYACWQLQSVCGSKITKSVNERDRQIGVHCRISIRKNRLTGKEWTVEIPIYNSYGIDDVGSCVDWLVAEKHWKPSSGKFDIPAWDFQGNRLALIRHIESNGLQFELRDIVTEVWQSIETKCQLDRPPRYS